MLILGSLIGLITEVSIPKFPVNPKLFVSGTFISGLILLT